VLGRGSLLNPAEIENRGPSLGAGDRRKKQTTVAHSAKPCSRLEPKEERSQPGGAQGRRKWPELIKEGQGPTKVWQWGGTGARCDDKSQGGQR